MVEVSLDWLLDILEGVIRGEVRSQRELITKYGLDYKLGIVEEEGLTWNVKMILKILRLEPGRLSEGCYDIFDEDDGDGDGSESDLVTRILGGMTVKLSTELCVMQKQLTECTESFLICYRLTQSHLRIVEKAMSHVSCHHPETAAGTNISKYHELTQNNKKIIS